MGSINSKTLKVIFQLLLIVISIYIGFGTLVALFQTKLIYSPDRLIKRTPTDIGLSFEDLMLEGSDGVHISAWYIPCADAKATILYFHGKGGNISDLMSLTKTLHALSYSVLLMDYRGYGKSEGYPSERGTYLDADAAWRYLTEQVLIPPSRIVIMGESLGGGVAIELASRHEPAALVVKSTFTSIADVGSRHVPWLPVSLILRHRYDSILKVPHIRCPKLFIHTLEDKLIPMIEAQKLFDAAAEPKESMITPGGHNQGGFMYDAERAQRLGDFINRALGANSAS